MLKAGWCTYGGQGGHLEEVCDIVPGLGGSYGQNLGRCAIRLDQHRVGQPHPIAGRVGLAIGWPLQACYTCPAFTQLKSCAYVSL